MKITKTTFKEKLGVLTCSFIGIPYIIDLVANQELTTQNITTLLLAISTIIYTLIGKGVENGTRGTLYNSKEPWKQHATLHTSFNTNSNDSFKPHEHTTFNNSEHTTTGANIKYERARPELTKRNNVERTVQGSDLQQVVHDEKTEKWRRFNGRTGTKGYGATAEVGESYGSGRNNEKLDNEQRRYNQRSNKAYGIGGEHDRTAETDYCELCTSVVDSSSSSENTTVSVTEEERRLLANIIYWEARGESLQGQIAVGAVVLNRVNSPRFRENDIRSVIFAPNQFTPARTRNMNLPLYALSESVIMATDYALQGVDPTNGALFFNGVQIPNTQYIKTIGKHIFSK
jgi:spore germination cell wall hydrolase CwlJ-like protein